MKILVGHCMVCQALQANHIPPKCYGSVPGHHAIQVSFSGCLLADLSQQHCHPLVVACKDFAQCYDKIAHSLCSYRKFTPVCTPSTSQLPLLPHHCRIFAVLPLCLSIKTVFSLTVIVLVCPPTFKMRSPDPTRAHISIFCQKFPLTSCSQYRTHRRKLRRTVFKSAAARFSPFFLLSFFTPIDCNSINLMCIPSPQPSPCREAG